ncbi:MAG: hypothetical protein Tsb0020_16790 [Haliangiales bacterium]
MRFLSWLAPSGALSSPVASSPLCAAGVVALAASLTACIIIEPAPAPTDPPAPIDGMPRPDPTDGGVADAFPDAFPDASGDAGPDLRSPFELPEGGEFRLERMQLGADDSDDFVAAQALFFRGQSPASRSFEGDPIALRPELRVEGYACNDYSAGDAYFSRFSPQMAAIAATREYYNAGSDVRLANAQSAGDLITMNLELNGVDSSSLLFHDQLYLAEGETTDVTRGAEYIPSVAGSLEYPGLDLIDGESITGELLGDPSTGFGTPKIFMPPAFTLLSPSEAAFFADAGVSFAQGEDFVIQYQSEGVSRPGWPQVAWFVEFMNADGLVEVQCARLRDASDEVGAFTIPREVFDRLGASDGTDGSVVVFGTLTLAAWRNVPTATRHDLVGIESKVARRYRVLEPNVQQ